MNCVFVRLHSGKDATCCGILRTFPKQLQQGLGEKCDLAELWLLFCMAVSNSGWLWEKVWSSGATASILHGSRGWGLMVCHCDSKKIVFPMTKL